MEPPDFALATPPRLDRNGHPIRPNRSNPKRGGRQKGTPNAMGRDLRHMILTALSHAGGVRYLREQAELNPVAFMGLLGKILPLQVKTDGQQPLLVDFRWALEEPRVVELRGTPTVDGEAEEIGWDMPKEKPPLNGD